MIRSATRVLLGGLLLCMATANSARADLLLDFEGLASEAPLDTYGGFLWENMFSLVASDVDPSGYVNGLVSGTNVAYNGFGDDASVALGPDGTGLFNFRSANLTAAFNDGLSIVVSGFKDGDLLYTMTVVVDTTGPTLFDFEFLGITLLTFSSSGGTPAGFTTGSGTQFVMDDMVLSSAVVPEPSSLSMAVLGLASLTGAWKRRRNPTLTVG